MKKVTIPDTVVTMGENAFGGCNSLVTVELPVNMTAIPYSAFNDCDNLVSVTGGEGIRAIGMLAFLNCPKLSEIDLSKVESISDDAFANCYALNPTGFSSQMHYLGGWTFQNTAIESLVVPDSVGVINRCSFYGCKQLKSVTFGMNVNWIYGLAFFDCDSLTSVTLPARISELKEGAFAECSSLADIYVLNAECILPDDYYARLNGWDPSDTLVSTLGIPGITTIHGHAGSTAEAYATKNGYAFEALPETCEYGYHTLSTTMTKEATCLTDGWKTIACSLCEYKREEVIHYPGHKIVNDVCENCNESFVAYSDQMNGGLWALNTDGTLYLYNAANGGDIPDAPWESYAIKLQKL